MQKYALPVVGALIFDESNRLFLMRSTGKFGQSWTVPGGEVNSGEPMEEALRREVYEQTRMNLEEVRFLGVGELIGLHFHYIFIEYFATADSSQSIGLNYEADEYGWFSEDELDGMELYEGCRDLIDRHWLKRHPSIAAT